MLRAIVQEIHLRMPEAKLVMVPDYAYTFCERGSLCLYQKLWLYWGGIRWGNAASFVPRWLRRKFGVYLDKEIDVVLDAAGFVYSAQLPRSRFREIAASSVKWKRRGTSLILLPQALGPFPDARRQRYLSTVVRNAELVYPRDKESYRYVVDVLGEQSNIRIAPDFTSVVQGVLPDSFNRLDCRFCIIPNSKMLRKTSTEMGNRYIDVMAYLAQRLKSAGARPFILLHEIENDFRLADEINRRANASIPVIRETGALAIKGIIAECDGVISSRFHGLVSALSQGVPAFGTGWSHKYRMLFEDYDFTEGLLDLSDSDEQIWRIIERFTSEPKVSELKSTLLSRAKVQKEATSAMWEEVISVITAGHR